MWGALAAVALATAVPMSVSPVLEAQSPQRATERPNIVVILTDDQRDGTVSAMPVVQRELVERGVTFTQAQSATPTCCPARASLLSGNLAKRTGVFANWAAEGGWSTFHQGGWDARTLATQLDEVGYHTVLSGKYLNGYAIPGLRAGLTGDPDYVPPGWDEWFSFGLPPGQVIDDANRDQGYHDYWTVRASSGGDTTYERHADRASDYSTDVFGRFAAEAIERAPADQPVFLLYTPYGPHAPFTPAPRHADAKVPELSEPALTVTEGKPIWVTSRGEVSPSASRQVRKAQARALLSVDDNVDRIIDTLEVSGRLANTIVVFASDNGMTWGEFHLIGSKNYPYVTDVPMVMRWDKAPRRSALSEPGSRDGRLASLTDVAATVLTAAGADASAALDSLNLVDPLAMRDSLLLSAARSRGEQGKRPMPPYCGVRTSQWLYARYATGFEELFRVTSDPQMLVNRAADPTVEDVVERFRRQIVRECDPAPAHFQWRGLR